VNAVEFWGTFHTFFLWGLEAWVVPPIQIIGLLSLGSLAVCILRPSNIRTHWRASYWFVFTQLLFYPLIIAVGAAFQAHTAARPFRPNPLGEYLLDALTVTSVLTACFWVWRMRELRWLAGSLVVLQEAILFGAMFIAGMSVTGDWL